jgi:hypothetical protein
MTQRSITHTLAWAIGGTMLTVLAGTCFAQGQPPAAPPGAREPEPGSIRERLMRRRADVERARELMDQAIERADKGEPIGDIMRELESMRFGVRGGAFRDGREGPDGQPGPGGPRERPGPGEPLGPGGPGMPGAGDDVLMDLRPGEPLTDEQRERITSFLRENAPRFATKLDELREADPKTADRLFTRMGPRIREAMAVRRRDPELFELRLEELRGGFAVLEAVKAYREARNSGEEGREERIAKAEADARAALVAQFDQRQALEAHELRTLEKNLERRRKEVSERASERDAVIERQIERLRENKPLPDGGPPRRGPEGSPDRPPPRTPERDPR